VIREAIDLLVCNQALSLEQASLVMEEIMEGKATPAQFASFVTALRMKGETVDEIAGMASVMRAKAMSVHVSSPVIDTCGTGGDKAGSFNISTAAAFVIAGAGLKVAKHGNRAMSSHCGSADVLEQLGVCIDLTAENVVLCIENVGIGFLFAPIFHPTMKHAASPRREIGIRNVFNILGPLTNPAGARFQVIGIPSEDKGETVAQVIRQLGTEHSLVVHGTDGMDEVSICAESLIWEVKQGQVLPAYTISPEELGLKRARAEEIKGETPEENATLLRQALGKNKGAAQDVVIMNAAAALIAGNKARDFQEGVLLAKDIIDSGKALDKLNDLIRLSQNLGQRH
jgi:anthranilate phosphoribosyltransferase